MKGELHNFLLRPKLVDAVLLQQQLIYKFEKTLDKFTTVVYNNLALEKTVMDV